MKLYVVICGYNYHRHIDSVHTSYYRANKRKNELEKKSRIENDALTYENVKIRIFEANEVEE